MEHEGAGRYQVKPEEASQRVREVDCRDSAPHAEARDALLRI